MKIKYHFFSWFCLLLMLCSILSGCAQQEKQVKSVSGNGRQVVVFAGDPYPPFVYAGDDGRLTGIDIELINEACKRLGMDYRYKLINWNNKDEILANGMVDGLWSCFSMDGREDSYAWTQPYLLTHHVIVVGKYSNIRDVSDLEGRRLVVQHSSQPEKIFLEHRQPGIPQLHDLYSVNNVDAMFGSLQMGYADATACNEIVARQYENKYPKDFVTLDKPLMQSHLGVAFAKNKTELQSKFNAVLQEMQKDGTIAKIVQKYEKML